MVYVFEWRVVQHNRALQRALVARGPGRNRLDGAYDTEPNPRGPYDTANTCARLDLVTYGHVRARRPY
jgi:hypothetical protein